METAFFRSPIGLLRLEQDGGALCAVRRVDAPLSCEPKTDAPLLCGPGADTPLLREAARQLAAYFDGALRAFDLPLAAQGSAFDRAVWRALTAIPYGERRAYGEIAAAIGRPKACRAVGGACSRNPLLIVVPCHRVVGASGKLTGFAAGIEQKRALLELEERVVHSSRYV